MAPAPCPRPRGVPGRAGPPPGAGLCARRRWCWPAPGGPAEPAASPPPAPGCRGCSCPASPPAGGAGGGWQGRAWLREARAQAAPPAAPPAATWVEASSSCTRACSRAFSCCSSHSSSWLGRCSMACRSFSVCLRSTLQSSSAFIRLCLSRSICRATRQPGGPSPRPRGAPGCAHCPGPPWATLGPRGTAAHLQLQVTVPHERGALLLALAGQAHGQVVVLVLVALELPAAGLALLLQPLHALLVLAQQAVLHPQLLDEVVLGAQQRRQVLHLLLQLHDLAHQELRQARLPGRVCRRG